VYGRAVWSIFKKEAAQPCSSDMSRPAEMRHSAPASSIWHLSALDHACVRENILKILAPSYLLSPHGAVCSDLAPSLGITPAWEIVAPVPENVTENRGYQYQSTYPRSLHYSTQTTSTRSETTRRFYHHHARFNPGEAAAARKPAQFHHRERQTGAYL